MNAKRNKVLSLVLAICMLVAMLPVGMLGAAAIDVESVSLDKTLLFLTPGDIDFLVETVLPAEADDTSVTWSSSDEAVATIDGGMVSAVAAGSATITAESVNGVTATAYVLVTDQTSFHYRTCKQHYGEYSTNAVAFNEITYDKTMKGAPNEITSTYRTLPETDPWMFGGASEGATYTWTASSPGRGPLFVANAVDRYVSMKIWLPEDGNYAPQMIYTKGVGYGTANVFLAPVSAADPTDAAYSLGAVSLVAPALTDGNIENWSARDLTAGEYIVTFKGPIAALFLAEFNLINPNYIESVVVPRTSLSIGVGEPLTLGLKVNPSTAPDQSVTWSSDAEGIATVDQNGVITGVSKGTANITVASVADPTKRAICAVTVGLKEFYYNYMKMAGFSALGMPTPSKTVDVLMKNWATDFKYTTYGSNDEVGKTLISRAWKVGTNSPDTVNWVWSNSAVSLGAYGSNTLVDQAVAMNIMIPSAGTYKASSIHSVWTAGNTGVDMYLAPVGAADKTAAEYKINTDPINHKAAANTEVEVNLNEVTVAAGEYVLTYKTTGAGTGLFIKGFKLVDATAPIAATGVSLDTFTGYLAADATKQITATVAPAAATDKTVTWSSSDESIATVTTDGLVTAVGTGIVTITATTNDGTNLSASCKLLVGIDVSYHYDYTIADLEFVKGDKVANFDFKGSVVDGSYDYANNNGSAPWMFVASQITNGSETAYCAWTRSSWSGVRNAFVAAANTGWSRMKISVAENGKYLVIPKIAYWSATARFTIHVAPVGAENPLAAEYLVYSGEPYSVAPNYTAEEFTVEREMAAGEYYVTYTETGTTHGTLIATAGLKLAKTGDYTPPVAPSVNVATINGAQIRTTGVQGIRFVSSISKADIAAADVVEYGTILIPTADITNADDFIIGATLNGHAVAKVPAQYLYRETDTEYQFTAVITNIASKNYTRAYSAKAYAICRDGTVIYSDVTASRHVYQVARAVLNDPQSGINEATRAVLQAIADIVEAPPIALTLTAPVEGQVASTTISGIPEDANYTGVASWTTTGGAAFSGEIVSGTTYTLTITLTRTSGTFGALQQVSLNDEAMTIALSADNTVLTITKSYDFKDSGYTGVY